MYTRKRNDYKRTKKRAIRVSLRLGSEARTRFPQTNIFYISDALCGKSVGTQIPYPFKDIKDMIRGLPGMDLDCPRGSMEIFGLYFTRLFQIKT